MNFENVDNFGKSLTANKEFSNWLGGLVGKRARGEITVEFNPASHLCYIFKSKGDFGIHVKFFGIPTGSCKDYDAIWAMNNEFGILKSVYNNGFNNRTCRVVSPLGIKPDFYAALATEYVGRDSVSRIMMDVATTGEDGKKLSEALKNTALALRRMHDKMPCSEALDMDFEFSKLKEDTVIGFRDKKLRENIEKAIDIWTDNSDIRSLGAVTIHGDANPTNFITNNGILYVLDFERFEQNRSPLTDLGFMIADIKHHFTFYGKDQEAGERYITGFLEAYSKGNYNNLKEIVRPYVGCGLIRITKFLNDDRDHRKWLRSEGFRFLS